MFKLLHNCIHFTHQQINAQNPSRQASAVHEWGTSRCTSWIQKSQRNQRSNYQHPLDHRKIQRIPENIYFCFIDYAKAFDCVYHNKLWKILKEMGIPDHLTYLLPNLYTGQWTGSNWERSISCHPAYLTYMQSTSCKMPGQMKLKLETRFPGEISVTSDMQMSPGL